MRLQRLSYLLLIAEWTSYCAVTSPGWPRPAGVASIEPRQITPQLRSFGLSVTFERNSKGERLVNFVPTHAGGQALAHVGLKEWIHKSKFNTVDDGSVKQKT
jgi:hypothetical protein